MQACYVWGSGAGDVCSTPVTVEVIAANPRNAHVVSARGGPSELYTAAWLQTPTSGSGHEIWLSHIRTGGKPMVAQATHLADVPGPVHPFISVPPNAAPLVQWVAWLDDQRLNYLLHANGEASAPESVKLNGSDWRIVPPILQQPEPRGGGLPGADILLHSPATEQLMIVHLQAGAAPLVDPPTGLAANRVRHALTAYLSSGKRQTYVCTAEAGGCGLYSIAWGSNATTSPAQRLAELSVSPLAADVGLSTKDEVFGAVFGEAQSGTPGFAFARWSSDPRSGFKDIGRTDVRLPSGVGVERAIVRIDTEGWPWALVLGDSKAPGWYFVRPTGAAAPLEVPAESKPTDILFRPGDDPVVVFTHNSRGFQFHKPN
jgi:hypothetical protein